MIILYINKKKNLEENINKIIYCDSRGYDPVNMKVGEYFKVLIDKKSNQGKLKDTEDCQRDSTRELKIEVTTKENKLQLKDNNFARENIPKVNNFIGIEINNIKDKDKEEEKKTPLKPKIISYCDYSLLKPNELFLDQRTFIQCIKDILIQKHSLISCLFKKSLLEPSFVRYIKLHFELNLQFAFSAVLFSDSYIEKRLTHQITVNRCIFKLV
jgi:hypothetical protein